MRFVAFALATLLLTACGTVRTYRYPLAQPTHGATPVPGARPPIYFEGNLPTQNMQELAIVEAVGYGTKASMEDVTSALQDEALQHGASAIVRVKVDCGYSQCHGWGVAVRLFDR